VHHWLNKLHMTISQPQALTLQSFIVLTHYILTDAHFTYPEGIEALIRDCLLKALNPVPSARMSEHVLVLLTTQPTELARQID